MITESGQPEDTSVYNERSLKTLARAIERSVGRFSFILVRCNYARLREQILQQLREICSVEFRVINLPPSTKTLHTTIRADLDKEQPSALIITGLENVNAIDDVLTTANQVRPKFPTCCPSPAVLWVNDEGLRKLIRLAPDLYSWAGVPIRFAIATDELIDLLQKTTDQVFTQILSVGAGKFLDNAALNLAVGSYSCAELRLAQQDLKTRGVKLALALEAGLQFLMGRDAYANNQMAQARQLYEQSLAFWQQIAVQSRGETEQSNNSSPTLLPSHSPTLEKQACVLFHLGLWWRRYAVEHRAEYEPACRQAMDYYQQCVRILQQANRPDLAAKFINSLGEVLLQLEQWDDLETFAKQSVELHQIYLAPLQSAYAYGLLAEVALAKSDWMKAKQYTETALKTNAKNQDKDLDWLQKIDQSWYLLLLAKVQQCQSQISAALKNLETAKAECKHEYNAQLYIRILEELRSLYFNQGDYLAAFRIKQEQRSIEAQYGFRAFIGAGRLQPQRQVINPSLAPVEQHEAIAQQMDALSGRQQDIKRLLERIGRTDCKLTIIHGQSGVGKSSIIEAGLVPALQRNIVGDRDALPVLLRVYTDWVKNLGDKLAEAIEGVQGINLSTPFHSTELILEQLRRNEDRNLLTVLIFDQFEEFFFASKNPAVRRNFYEFIRDCLNIPFVKVILSLREDYLHYLLECNRLPNMDVINNNILDKDILYYLGNFLPEDAELVIQNLTKRSKFHLEPALIDELVRDLAGDFGDVRPIELQVVGAQLQTEDITRLSQYKQRGPKRKLVERYLEEVVKDCGPTNERAAQLVLYLLTDENNTRPLKTRAQLVADLAAEADKLDLVLEIFVRSGLVFLLPETSGDRYQLVHDYLVSFIRQQKGAALLAELEQAKEQKKLTEQKLNRFLKRALFGSTAATVILTISTVSAVIFAQQADRERHRSEISKIEALNSASEALLLSHDQLGALVASVKAAKQVLGGRVEPKLKNQTIEALQKIIVTNVQERNRFQGHTDWVYSVSFSPDGQTLASASADKTIKLWTRDGREIQTLQGHRDRVTSVSFSPDGQTLASADGSGVIKLWLRDGKELKTFQGHSKWIYSLSFSPDGQTLASASYDKTIKLWGKDGKALQTLRGHNNRVTSVSFSPDGQTLASADGSGVIKLWLRDGKELKTFQGHSKWIYSLSFSPDGQTLASASDDKTIKLWSKDGKALQTLRGHSEGVLNASFSPDSSILATAGADNIVKIWRRDGILLQTLQGHTGFVNKVDFSPDGRTIASASFDNTVKIWRLDSTLLQTLYGHSDRVWDLSFSPDGKTLASASADDTVKVWRLDGKLLQSIPNSNTVSFSPNGQILASASANNAIKLWRKDGKELRILHGHDADVINVSFSPDGQTLASASSDKTVRLWRSDGTLLKILKSHSRPVCCVSFSPNGHILASASDDKTIKLWRRDVKELKTIWAHIDRVTSVSFSPNGQTLASASVDKTVRLWKLDGTLLQTFQGHHAEVKRVSFSPDGQTLASASADKTIKLWRLDGKLLQTLQLHRDGVNSVSFSRDGQLLASASDDKTVILWNWKILRNMNQDNLLERGCNWLYDYMKSNPNVKGDRYLCDNILGKNHS